MLLALLSAAAPAAARAAPPPVPVPTATIHLAPLPRTLRVLGEVDSLGRTTLVAPVTGEIVGPFRAEGEISAGAVVARNVPATLRSALDRARADLAFARATDTRTHALVAAHLRTKIARDQAERDLRRAEGTLAGLRQEAAQQVIRAPFAGTLHYLIAPGTVVFRGTPIARISGRATPWIDARIAPEAARHIRPGAPVRVAGTGWSGTGQVASVGQDARPLGLVRIRIALPKGNPLIPGEWVRARLDRPGPPAPVVPRGAVLRRAGRTLVFVIRAGRAVAVPVRVRAAQGGQVWIAGALHPGETVAVGHVTRLAATTPVRPLPIPSPARSADPPR